MDGSARQRAASRGTSEQDLAPWSRTRHHTSPPDRRDHRDWLAINVLQQNSIIGIIACGMTFAIILGGFDLSVGSVTALASVVGATFMIDLGERPAFRSDDAAGVACLLVGATNGWLIAYLGVNPFVATLGTMTVVRGLIYVATNASPRFGVPYSFTTLGLGRLFGVPNPAILFLVVAALLGFVLHRTRFGHYVYAVGGNAVASARRWASTPRRVRFAVYVLVAAVRGRCRGSILDRADGQRDAAGGARLRADGDRRGDRRRRLAAAAGAAACPAPSSASSCVGVVANGLNLFGVSPFWQPVATGLILIAAVAFDGYSKRGGFRSF